MIVVRRTKSSFLATAGNDLRQPVQTLALLNGMLRRMVQDTDSAEALAQRDGAIGVMSRLLQPPRYVLLSDTGLAANCKALTALFPVSRSIILCLKAREYGLVT